MKRRYLTKLQNDQQPRRGFTIVELLIVIVVIAILAAITVVAYKGVQERAKTSVVNNAASSWAKILNMQLAQGAYISAASSCLGRSAADFPEQDGFAAGECLQVSRNGDSIFSASYDPDTLEDWKGSDVPPNGLLPVTSFNGTDGSGDVYTYRGRGVVPTVGVPGGGVMWIPVVKGECGPGTSLADAAGLQVDSEVYGGDLCVYGFL